MAPSGSLYFSLAIVAVFLASCNGSYVITAPREWVHGERTQVCVFVSDPSAAAGSLTLALNHTTRFYKQEEKVTVILPPTTIPIPAGAAEFCEDVQVPDGEMYYGQLNILGQVAGSKVNHSARVNLKSGLKRTITQTDKYLYKPGQTVKMRMLTIAGADFSVSTEQYPEVWVTSPSRTRIAQWKNVDNSRGLVHVEMTLADEPEEGHYSIHVKRADNATSHTNFEVKEYVLPRYQVTLKPPAVLLPTQSQFKVTVCAKYTFGELVKGNVSLEVNNHKSRGCQVIFNITEQINGCKDLFVESTRVRLVDCDVGSLGLEAWVTEEGTGVVLGSRGRATVSRRPVNFKLVYKDNYAKPNLPYLLKVKAELPDESPASGVAVEVCAGDACYNITTPQNGVITTYISNYNTNQVKMKALTTRAALDESFYTTTLERYYSPSNSSLLIHAPEDSLQCTQGSEGLEHVLPVFFSATEQASAAITVQIVSRRSIQVTHKAEYELVPGELPIMPEHLARSLLDPVPGTIRGTINIPLTIPHTASPTARVVVWMVRSDGEVVSDSRELNIEPCLSNTAELTWSHSKLQPGDQAQLKLTAAPNSFCSLGVVDKSVELLNPNGDPFSLSALFNPLKNYKTSRWSGAQVDNYAYCRNQFNAEEEDSSNYFTDYVDALKMFDDSGLFIFSNLHVETRPCEKQEYHSHYSYHREHVMYSDNDRVGLVDVRTKVAASPPRIVGQSVETTNEQAVPTSQEDPRSDFPETWLWDLQVLPESGEVSQSLTLPDTITQWVGKAVCVHPQEGIGLTQKVNITTFTPFFLDLTLPPSMKRGEILAVKISVFNYLDLPLPVAVTVHDSVEYELVDDAAGGMSRVCVAAQSKVVVTARIKPTALGEVNITVGATVDHENPDNCGTVDASITRRDTLIKPVTVEAEGFPRETTWTKYICHRDLEEGSDALGTWEVAAPSAIVEGSDRGWITVVGDLLALSLENLGGLIRMPYGCGEQNMVNFAPNIYILQYLRVTRQEAPEATEKLLRFMTTGYQRQLLYRHSDGAFSAFGNADESGSTWLTAFVLKSFAQAKAFISIDNKSLTRTLNWLKDTQEENGCFRTVGKVFSKGMQGGVGGASSPVPLTAYVLMSLLEGGEEPTSSAVVNATICLASHTTRDPYTLALKAYALALAQLPQAEEVLQQLMEQAVVAKNSTHWELPRGPGRSNSLGVETAGYAILAMMTVDPVAYEQQARKVVKWITAKRNGRGGFYSTQDTVVALQAMASYESHQFQGELNLVATVKAPSLDHSFPVDENNKLLTQLVTIPDLPASIHLSMVGQGCAIFQSVLRYNVHEPEPSDAFTLTVGARTVADKTCVTKRINACVAYLLPDGQSNMAVMEINLISGYIPEKEDLKQIVSANNTIKRYEVDGSKVSLYADELYPEELCVNLRALREVDVENPKPGSVVVYDYYQPEFSVSKTYTFPSAQDCLYAW